MAIKYVPYYPEPIEGQALLDNFKRTLRYKGSDEVGDRIRRGMPLYEVETLETVGENLDGNMVIRGECVSACAYLKEQGVEVDLVYIDPPFASGADYAKKVYIRRNPKVAEAIEKAEEELPDDELKAFEEKMYGDVWDKEKYLNWMYENLMAIKSVMSETASIYVHLDYHIGHYVKVLMDEVFGEMSFRNDIVWCYSGGGIPKHEMPHKHDMIFWYSKSPDDVEWNNQWTYNIEYRDYSEGTMQRGRTKVKGDNAALRKEGTPINDWWTDIPKITSPTDPEKLDYPTQKSEALLERIIHLSSEPGMLIADFFGGSGVTAAVAHKNGCRFIHSDIGVNSVQITRDRLKAENATFSIVEICDGVSLYRNPQQTMEKLKRLIPGLRNEDDLDSFWEGAISDSKLGTIPVYVPNLMDSSTRILDEVLMNRIIHEAMPDLPGGVKKVIVYYIDVIDLAQMERFIDEDDTLTIEVELRDLKEVLDDVVLDDRATYFIEKVKDKLYEEYRVSINTFYSDRVMSKLDAFNQKGVENTLKGKKFIPITISEEGLELIEYISLDCSASEGVWHSDSELKIDKNGYVILNGQKTKDFWDGALISEKKPLRMKVRNICGDESVYVFE